MIIMSALILKCVFFFKLSQNLFSKCKSDTYLKFDALSGLWFCPPLTLSHGKLDRQLPTWTHERPRITQLHWPVNDTGVTLTGIHSQLWVLTDYNQTCIRSCICSARTQYCKQYTALLVTPSTVTTIICSKLYPSTHVYINIARSLSLKHTNKHLSKQGYSLSVRSQLQHYQQVIVSHGSSW